MNNSRDESILKSAKAVASEIHRADQDDASAWLEIVAQVLAQEEADPRTRNVEYMAKKMTSALLASLREQRKPVLYSEEQYLRLLTQFVLLHTKPLFAAASLDMALSGENPTELIEDGIRMMELTAGAEFTISAYDELYEAKLRRGLEQLGSAASADQREAFTEAFREQWSEAVELRKQNLDVEGLTDLTVDYLRRAENKIERTEIHSMVSFILSTSDDSEFTAISLMQLADSSPHPFSELQQTFAHWTRQIRANDTTSYHT